MFTARPKLAQLLTDDHRAFERGAEHVERVCAQCDWVNRSSLTAPRRLRCVACKAELERRVVMDRKQPA